MAQQLKDSTLSLLWLGLLLWREFDPWPGNFCMPHVQPKKKEKVLIITRNNVKQGRWGRGSRPKTSELPNAYKMNTVHIQLRAAAYRWRVQFCHMTRPGSQCPDSENTADPAEL